MAYCICYFNLKIGDMVVDFLGFTIVNVTTSNALYEDFVNFLSHLGLALNKLVGIGTDGAANLCGKNN